MIFWSLWLDLFRALWLVPLTAALAGPEPKKEVMPHPPELLGDKTPAGVDMSAGVRRPYLSVVK